MRDLFIGEIFPDTIDENHAISFRKRLHEPKHFFELALCIYGTSSIFMMYSLELNSIEREVILVFSDIIDNSMIGDLEGPSDKFSLTRTAESMEFFDHLGRDLRREILSKMCIKNSIIDRSIDPIDHQIIEITDSVSITRLSSMQNI
jgi:hypothetical protein